MSLIFTNGEVNLPDLMSLTEHVADGNPKSKKNEAALHFVSIAAHKIREVAVKHTHMSIVPAGYPAYVPDI